MANPQCKCYQLSPNAAVLTSPKYVGNHILHFRNLRRFIRAHNWKDPGIDQLVKQFQRPLLFYSALHILRSVGYPCSVPESYRKRDLALLIFIVERLFEKNEMARCMINSWRDIDPIFVELGISEDATQLIRLYCGVITDPIMRPSRCNLMFKICSYGVLV